MKPTEISMAMHAARLIETASLELSAMKMFKTSDLAADLAREIKREVESGTTTWEEVSNG